jgi:hypothetical protein
MDGVGETAKLVRLWPILMKGDADLWQQQNHQERGHGHENDKDVLERLAHFTQGEGPHEPPDHQTTPIKREVAAGSLFGHAPESGRAKRVHDRAANGDLAPDIHEDGYHTQHGMRVFQSAGTAANLLRVGKIRQMGELEEHSQNHEHRGKAKVGNFDRIRPVHAGMIEDLKDQPARDDGADGCAKGIERLRQVEAARSRAFRTEDRHVWIGGNLQHGKPNADDE